MKYCPYFGAGSIEENLWCFGFFIFFLLWIIFVPVVIASRLEKIIKILQEKK